MSQRLLLGGAVLARPVDGCLRNAVEIVNRDDRVVEAGGIFCGDQKPKCQRNYAVDQAEVLGLNKSECGDDCNESPDCKAERIHQRVCRIVEKSCQTKIDATPNKECGGYRGEQVKLAHDL